ncbi:MAG TPA: ATP-binding cassette domain-containing protein, partial [bacterium]|nr:ATP-binding cassette domain-containing protein [bacterium]
EDLIGAMVGRSVSFERDPDCVPCDGQRLECRETGAEIATLQVKEGEIFGIYGLVGSGQPELCQALFGLRDTPRMSISLNAKEIGNLVTSDRVRAGLGYVPADRLEQGLFYQMTVGENMSLASLSGLTRLGFINESQEQRINDDLIQKLRVKTQGIEQRVNQLSGGNQQKVLLARWLESQPQLLILEEPTQGVDVGAKGEIHKIITSLAKSGVSILLISSEIPELMALSHRIGIMRDGKLVAELDATSATEEEILREALPNSVSQMKSDSAMQEHRERHPLSRLGRKIFEQRELSIALFIGLIIVVFGVTTPGFATWRNLSDVLVNNSIVLIGALGIMFVIISGGIDISVGAIMGLAAVAT